MTKEERRSLSIEKPSQIKALLKTRGTKEFKAKIKKLRQAYKQAVDSGSRMNIGTSFVRFGHEKRTSAPNDDAQTQGVLDGDGEARDMLFETDPAATVAEHQQKRSTGTKRTVTEGKSDGYVTEIDR